MYQCTFGYGLWDEVDIPYKNLLTILEPHSLSDHNTSDKEKIVFSLMNPIESLPLSELVKGKKCILILVDDYTRLTPTNIILPLLLEEFKKGEVFSPSVKILVASGTHRGMSDSEKRYKYGDSIVDSISVLDHIWYREENLVSLGATEHGTEIQINKLLLESDFIIGIGHIVPHRVAGFSGGSKIVQPGVCGAVTTGQTHWLSAHAFTGKQIMGKLDNPVRSEINEVGKKAGLSFIVNTIQGGDGNVHTCVSGDPIAAHIEGCFAAMSVYGCEISTLADIVIVDAFPSNVNMWQSSKGIYSADLALKEDGVLILVTPCPEGVALEHPEIEYYGYSNPDKIQHMVEEGNISDLTIAAHILHVGRVITGTRKALLVSPGIEKSIALHIGFIWAENLTNALSKAFEIKGEDASVTIIRHGGEVMPIYK